MTPEPDPEIRLVPMTKEQYKMIVAVGVTLTPIIGDHLRALAESYERAPADYWDQIAEEFRRHRCKDPDCFTESVLMRLGVIRIGNPLSPYGF